MRTVEQHQDIPYSPKLTDAKGRVVSGIMNVLNPAFVSPAVENILIKTDTVYAPNFGDHLIRGVQAGYETPVLLPVHQAILDALFIRDAARAIRGTVNEHLPQERQMEAWALILAASLHYGQQGPMRTRIYHGLSESFEKGQIRPLLTVRRQDVTRYGMKKYWNPDQEKADAIAAIEKGHGIIVHPEGTAVGETMNPFSPWAIFTAISTVEEAGKKALIIPISKTGSKRIERRNKLPTFTAIASGLNLKNEHITGVYVHTPMRFDEGELGELYRAGKKNAINDLIGGIIASQLPENERGPYAEHVRTA
ncbi:MAG: hypothetical protein KBD51_03755 [Candidatus Levybacteria bacterium]|nr:hypothetical protein [Candidatus Levybacteria bacterium]